MLGTFRPDRINAVADRFGVVGKEAQECVVWARSCMELELMRVPLPRQEHHLWSCLELVRLEEGEAISKLTLLLFILVRCSATCSPSWRSGEFGTNRNPTSALGD
jgi:hypothetical protein